jgi:hypothetical protein
MDLWQNVQRSGSVQPGLLGHSFSLPTLAPEPSRESVANDFADRSPIVRRSFAEQLANEERWICRKVGRALRKAVP